MTHTMGCILLLLDIRVKLGGPNDSKWIDCESLFTKVVGLNNEHFRMKMGGSLKYDESGLTKF